jgi:hypothetical protein
VIKVEVVTLREDRRLRLSWTCVRVGVLQCPPLQKAAPVGGSTTQFSLLFHQFPYLSKNVAVLIQGVLLL